MEQNKFKIIVTNQDEIYSIFNTLKSYNYDDYYIVAFVNENNKKDIVK